MSKEADFTLHPQLAADCHRLGQLGHALLLLHRNASLHWFILVPQTQLLDVTDLPAAQRAGLLEDAARVGHVLKERLAYPRVNLGALGLLVPQLHLHVIGRREGDACWPGPVWGALPPGGAYAEDEVERLRALFATDLRS